jgi:hypothetical protein
MISASSEIRHTNRMMTSTSEFLKIKLIKLKNKKIGHGDWVMEHAVIYVCI